MGVVSHSNTEIVVRTPQGVGLAQDVVVTAGGQSSPPGAFNYDAPQITAIMPQNGPTSAVNMTSGGAILVTLTGSNFGRLDLFGDKIQVVVDGIPPTVLNSSSFVAVGHQNLIFKLPPGQGENIDVRARIGSQFSNPVKFSYDAPVITKILTGYCLVGT